MARGTRLTRTAVFRNLGNLPGKYQKKTRLDEGYEDLFNLIDGANNLSGQARRDFLFDNVDIAAMVNYMATNIVIHNTDFPHKNYFLYRDTEGTARWTMHPWDMDLTFGRNWQGTVLNDEIWADRDSIPGKSATVSPSHPLVGEAEHKNWDNRWNKLIDALYEEPEFLVMYHRRLRTMCDWLLADGKYEARLDELTLPMTAEAALDRAEWGQYGMPQSMAEAAAILKSDYLQVRRTHLLATPPRPGGGAGGPEPFDADRDQRDHVPPAGRLRSRVRRALQPVRDRGGRSVGVEAGRSGSDHPTGYGDRARGVRRGGQERRRLSDRVRVRDVRAHRVRRLTGQRGREAHAARSRRERDRPRGVRRRRRPVAGVSGRHRAVAGADRHGAERTAGWPTGAPAAGTAEPPDRPTAW